VDKQLLVQELRDEYILTSQSSYVVYLCQRVDIPVIMQEIGRLRELTFQAAGEGTGKALDLDQYDDYYWQLFIWDKEELQIVGGYRIGAGKDIMAQFGIEGFYTNSLFKIHPDFGETLNYTAELGRSFVVPSHQKKRLPLFLLWKGILHFLLRYPHYRFLFGPVSISKFYSDISKSAIIYFVKKYYYNSAFAKYIRPRKPYEWVLEDQYKLALENSDLGTLNQFITTIEPQHLRVPVLLKQYIYQNAKFLGFNLDPNFNDALDGLMILNLQDLPGETLERLKKEW